MNKTKLVIIQRICAHYNVPLFQKIANVPNVDLILYYSNLKDIKDAKLQNTIDIVEFKTKKLFTLYFCFNIRGKPFHVFFYPFILFHLFKDKPDVIICEGESNLLNNIFIVLYAKITKTPYIWWGLGRVRANKPSVLRKIFHPLIKYMLKNARAILAYSVFAKDFYSSYGINKNKIFVAYNCIDTDKAKQDVETYFSLAEQQKNKLKLNNKKIILFVGSFSKEKRIENLILAYEEIKRDLSNVALLLIGDGETKQDIEKLVKNKALQDVFFVGRHIEDASLYFLMGDVFVLPGEGGLAINQAMVHGLPIVTVPADGTELDMVIDNENGYIVDSNNINVLAKAVIKILKDENKRQKMGQKSKELVETRFNIKNMVQIFINSIDFSLGDKD